MKKILSILSVILLLTSSVAFAHSNHSTIGIDKDNCTPIQEIQANRYYFCETCNGLTEHKYNSITGQWDCIECSILEEQ